ncbi:MAG: hypothetical protein ACYDDI_14530 [Candidatus Acidiferrales bacterium]
MRCAQRSEDAVARATRIFVAASRDKIHYVAKFAVHGSSTLRDDRNPKGSAANWRAVLKFLKGFEK